MKLALPGFLAAILVVLAAGLGPQPQPTLSPALVAALNGNAGLIAAARDGAAAQVFGTGSFRFEIPGIESANDFGVVGDPALGNDYNSLFPELGGPGIQVNNQPPAEIIQLSGRLGVAPEALVFNQALVGHLNSRYDGLAGERDASGNLLYDDEPVARTTVEGLLYVQEGTARQFEKQSAQLQAIQDMTDAQRLSMAKDLLVDAEVVQDAYMGMIFNEPLNYTRSGRRVSRQGEYESLMRQADAAQQAGNEAEATRLRNEANRTGWGVWLRRRGEFFARLNENPLLGIYGDPSWAPFDEGYFFQSLYWEFYTKRQIPSTSADREAWDTALLNKFDTYIQIGIDNANAEATRIWSANTVDDLIQFGGPKYGYVQDFQIGFGNTLGSDRPFEYVNSARGFYDEVEADNATSDMGWTIFFVSAAALSSIVIPGSGGLILTATFSVGEIGYETIKLVNIEMEETEMLNMAPLLGFENLGPIQDANSDQWGNVFMAAGFGVFDITALRRLGSFARRTDDVVDLGRTADAATSTTKAWGHHGQATVEEAFGNPNLTDDTWVHFGPSSMESGVRQNGVNGYGNRSYWLRWGEIKGMNQGQLRWAIGESSASGLSDLKLMVVAPDGANIRRINGNYGLRDEGVIDGAVEGGTFYRASDEVTIGGGVASPAPTRGLDLDDAAAFSGRINNADKFEDLDDAVGAARDAGIPEADIEFTLDYMRRKMDADPSYKPGGPEFKQFAQMRYAETHGYVIVLDRGRAGRLEMEEDLLRYSDGTEPTNIRVVGFTSRPVIQELLARAQLQQTGGMLGQAWARFEPVVENILRHTDEDLAKWVAFDRAEGGLYRIFPQDDIDNLRRIFPEYTPDGRSLDSGLETLDEYNDVVNDMGMGHMAIPRGRAPGTLPPPPGGVSGGDIFNLGNDAFRFGGTAGLGAVGLGLFAPSEAGAAEPDPDFQFDVFITSEGGSTGPVMTINVLNHGKPATIEGSGVILEPLDMSPEQLQQLNDGMAGLGGDNLFSSSLNAYCLEKQAAVPTEGMVYGIAPAEMQAQFAPMGLIIGSAPSVFDQLNPDSDPEDYYHSIVQWSVWTQAEEFNQASFGEAFLQHAMDNIEAGGQEWQPEWNEQVEAVIPNRWNDIGIVLGAAGF